MKSVLKGGKKGQFFLISSLIIITILLSFVTTRSSIKVSPVQYKVFNLGEELSYETADVMDYGIYNTQTERGDVLESWAKNFSNYQGFSGQEQFIFVYTEGNQAKGLIFSRQNSGDVIVEGGEGGFAVSNEANIEATKNLGTLAQGINYVEIAGVTITIDYEQDQPNFFFVIRSEGGEVAQKQE